MLKKLIYLIVLFSVFGLMFGCINSNDLNGLDASVQENIVGQGNGFNATGVTHEEASVMDFPFEEISGAELIALEDTLFDEFKAQKTYEFVLNKFGQVNPFVNIVNAEQSHYNEIKAIYEKYDLNVPVFVNDFNFEINSVLEACELAVTAEEENIALYESKFSSVDNQDIISVFTNLMLASKDKHLPAFQRCVARES